MTIPSIGDARNLAKKHNQRGMIIMFFTEDGQVGTASYGKDKRHCEHYRRVSASLIELFLDGRMDAEPYYGGFDA